jgi:hypothetical protein
MANLTPPRILRTLREIETELWGKAEDCHDGSLEFSRKWLAADFNRVADRLGRVEDLEGDIADADNRLSVKKMLENIRSEFQSAAREAAGKTLDVFWAAGVYTHGAYAMAHAALSATEYLADRHKPWREKYEREIAAGKSGVLPPIHDYAR